MSRTPDSLRDTVEQLKRKYLYLQNRLSNINLDINTILNSTFRQVDTYNDLLTLPDPQPDELVNVRNSQGIKFINYRGSGIYRYDLDTDSWIDDDTDVFTQLNSIINELAAIQLSLGDKLDTNTFNNSEASLFITGDKNTLDSAIQPGDNISQLVNDTNFVSENIFNQDGLIDGETRVVTSINTPSVGIRFRSYDNTISDWNVLSDMSVTNGGIVLQVGDGDGAGGFNTASIMQITPDNGIFILDGSEEGLYYVADYSSTTTKGDRWIVDKGYVDSVNEGSVTVHNDISDAGSGAIITIAERNKLSGIENNAKDDQNASEVDFNNTNSGLTSTNVQSAIDEMDTAVDLNTAKVSADGSINTHSDVDLSTPPIAGDLLGFNGTTFVPQNTSNGFTIFGIWAEENAVLTNNNRQWSFGNGSVGNVNIILPLDAELFALSLDAETGTATVSIDVMQDDNLAITTKSFAGLKDFETLASPIQFTAGECIGFRTNTVTGGTVTDARICAWFRVRSTPASTSVINDLLDVSAGTISSGQILMYNGSNYSPIALDASNITFTSSQGLSSLDVSTAIDEVQLNLNNEASTRQTNDEGTVSIHNDIDTSNLTGNNDGWVLKIEGGVIRPFYKQVLSEPTISLSPTTTPLVHRSETLTLPRSGTYSFKTTYSYSCDTQGDDIVCTATLDGASISSSFSEVFRIEMKDSAGNEGDGRGTNQKGSAHHIHFVTIPAAGNYTFAFSHFPAAGDTSAIWDWSCIIEEEINII